MIDSYKNIERLRYRVNKDLIAMCAEIKKNNEEQRIMFINETFSAIVSAVAALFFNYEISGVLNDFLKYIFENFFNKEIPLSVLTIMVGFCSIFILIVVTCIINKILIGLKRWKFNKEPEGKDTTDYTKEFDNIACDSVIVSIQYKDIFLNTEQEDEKTLYYFEAIHYLETASVITEKLCEDSNNIKSSKNVYGVDIYRIHNIKSVMIDLWEFLHNRRTEITLDKDDLEILQMQLDKIKQKLDMIEV